MRLHPHRLRWGGVSEAPALSDAAGDGGAMGNRPDAHDPSASRAPSQRIWGGMSRMVWTSLRLAPTQVGSPTSRARIEAAAKGHKYCLVMEPGRDGDRVVTSRKGVGRFVMT